MGSETAENKYSTVPFLFFCLQINGKEQSTRGVGSVAPHISITERNEVGTHEIEIHRARYGTDFW